MYFRYKFFEILFNYLSIKFKSTTSPNDDLGSPGIRSVGAKW